MRIMASELSMLKNSLLFKDMSDAVVQKFLDTSETKRFAKDELIYAEMQENEDIAFILEGEVRAEVTIDREGSGVDLGPGEFAGPIKFLQQESPVNILTASAKTDAQLLMWKASDWRRICDQDTQTGYTLALRVGQLLVKRMLAWHINVLNNVSWGIE